MLGSLARVYSTGKSRVVMGEMTFQTDKSSHLLRWTPRAEDEGTIVHEGSDPAVVPRPFHSFERHFTSCCWGDIPFGFLLGT